MCDMENDRFIPSSDSPPEKPEASLWFIFKDHRMAVLEEEDKVSLPRLKESEEQGLSLIRQRRIGTLDGFPCYCSELEDTAALPAGMSLRGLRYLYSRLDEVTHAVAMRAIHMIEWDRTVRFCSRCGAQMSDVAEMNAKSCPVCGLVTFPRLSPAVIMLVEKEGKILLARSPRFKEVLYSVLAGFVEPGETLEDAVRREIEEEVGIRVKNIRYFGSQPWPFPDSLMIGFTAEYESGEIVIDDTEIIDAGWYDPGNLPPIPGRISIARRLIDAYLEKSREFRGDLLEKVYGLDE